jgi:hypothetical protein
MLGDDDYIAGRAAYRLIAALYPGNATRPFASGRTRRKSRAS